MHPQTARLGVAALDTYFSGHGWLFREQLTHDYGIDAHVEIVDGPYPSGKIIAFQIKSGPSFFKEETADAYVFRTDDKHIGYWLNHAMPVVIVLYHPDTKQLFWQVIAKDTAEATGKHWKVLVPKAHLLVEGDQSLPAFLALTQPEPYVRRLNRLRLDRHWIEKVAEGAEVKVQFDDWVNKSLPRFQLTITCDDESQEWPMVYGSGMSITALLDHYVPWADFALDHDAHSEGAKADWEAQCYSFGDSETGEVFYSQTFDEWYKPDEGIVPVSSNGEVESYSLVLTLNDLGNAFLTVDDYLAEGDDFEKDTFTLE
jgi:hypothetical protein